jgi:ATP-binding cassette subfamily B protein
MVSMSSARTRAATFFLRIYLRYPWLFGLSMGGAVIGISVDLMVPRYLKHFFDNFSTGNSRALLSIAGTVTALKLTGWLFGRIHKVAGNSLRPLAAADVEAHAFGHIINHSYGFFSNTFAGAITKKIGRLQTAVRGFHVEIAHGILPIIVTVTGVAISLLFVNPFIALVFTGVIAAFILITQATNRSKRAADKIAAKADSERGGHVADALTNALTVKLFSGAPAETAQITAAGKKWAALKTKANNYGERTSAIFWLFSALIEGGLLAYGASAAATGTLTIGDIAMLQTYVLLVLASIKNIDATTRAIDEYLGDSAEALELIDLPHDIEDAKTAKPLMVSEGAISFKDVSFGYVSRRSVLTRLDIAPKEKVALVGPSGAGKSTVTKLLLRLVDVTKGTIRIDGQSIAKVTQESLRQAVSLVPQDPSLFHRSLMENIRYGRPGATDDEVIEAAKRARCHDFISALPEGYASLVGERGVKLSGGERQRVAIARAILKDAPILVLDEATSALDSESERAIHEALKELMAGKTVIAIAHRLSTIMGMDRIVVVEDGKVAAIGTHDELLGDMGTYAKLWNIQAGSYK